MHKSTAPFTNKILVKKFLTKRKRCIVQKQKKVAECKRLPPLYYIGILLFHEGVFHMAIAAKEIGHIHPFLSGQLQRQHTQEAIG